MKKRSNVPVSIPIKIDGFQAWESPSGKIFYRNAKTGCFTWEKPAKRTKNKSRVNGRLSNTHL